VTPPPWWTQADQSELDLLAHEFVKAIEAHRQGCSVCSAGGPWCKPLCEAGDGILDWRHGRELRSRAVWLRAQQIAREERQLHAVGLEGARAA
jgi:hypothetical protein